MKPIKIYNHTELIYRDIGSMIDELNLEEKENNIGGFFVAIFKVLNKTYGCSILIKKSQITLTIYEESELNE